MGAKTTLKDLLTYEEKKHIEILREQMNSSRTFLGIFINWRKVKKIIKLAEDRAFRGVMPQQKLIRGNSKYAHNRVKAITE